MKTTKMSTIVVLALGLMFCFVQVGQAAPMGTAFTYQGRLMDKNRPADGLYDFQFKLYDSNDPCTGTQLASPIDINDLDVIDGHFVVELDFGSGIFDGNAVWLETRIVRSPMGSDPAALSPLLELTPTPYALYAQTAGGVPGGISGSGTADYIAKFTGPNTIGDSVIYESGGNVGIGTTSPDAKLEVKFDNLMSNAAAIAIENTTLGGQDVFDFKFSGTPEARIRKASGGDLFISTLDGRKINLWTGGVNRLTVTGAGNVGIGTTSPRGKLDVEGDGSNIYLDTWTAQIYIGDIDGDGDETLFTVDDNASTFTFENGNVGIGTTTPTTKLDVVGTVNATAFVGDGSGLTDIAGDSDWTESGGNVYRETGNVGIGTTNPTHPLDIYTSGNYIANAHTTGAYDLIFNVVPGNNKDFVLTNNGAGGGIALSIGYNKKLVVANGGNVGIGTTSPTEALEVNGTVKATAFSGDGSGLTNLPVIADSDWTISGNDMYSAVSGNVGIGTTTPSEKLEINGNININSVYKIGGDSVLSALGTENILVGIGAGANNTGLRNTFLGNYAGYSNTGGHSNTFLGRSAGFWNTTGLRNIFIGSSAGNSNTTGYDNTFLGTAAGFWNTVGLRNIFIGSDAGNSNTTGYCNTFSGYSAGRHNTTGYHNTFLGDSAGRYNTTGSYNTFVGDLAGRHNTTGAGNVFIGNQAGYNETGSNKLYIANSTADPPLIYGDFSTGRVGIGTTSPSEKLDVNGNINVNSVYKIKRDTVLSTLGTDNTFVGIKAGANNTTGNYNTFSGNSAGYSNTTGNSNTFLGRYAGYSNTTGYGNTFLGRSAGYSNTEGSDNTFLGSAAGRYNTTGSHNTFLGIAAGSDNTTGYNNTFLGEGAGFRNTTGKYNTFLGHAAGNSNTKGTGNVFIGYHAGYDETGSDKLYIANSYANPPLIYGDFDTGNVGIGGTLSPQDKLEVSGGMMTLDGGPGGDITGIRIRENDDMRWTFLYKTWDTADKLYIRDEVGGRDVMTFEPTTGNVGIGTTNPLGFKLAVNGSAAKPGGGAWSVYSDRRLKKNIEPLAGALDRMLQLEGVSFEYSNSDHFSYVEGEQIGMIAQEVEKVFPDWVDENGGYKTVTYRGFEAITVEAFRQLRKEKDAEITALKEQLRTQNESFDQRLSALESMMTQRPVGITREVQ